MLRHRGETVVQGDDCTLDASQRAVVKDLGKPGPFPTNEELVHRDVD